MRLALVLAAVVACLASPTVAAQVWGEIEGRVADAATGEPIPGANVVIAGTNFGSNTNAEGRYRFRIPEGTYGLRVTYVGYETVTDTVVVRRGRTTAYSARLREAVLSGGEAEVVAQGERQVGVSTIDPRTIRSIPTPLGNDPLRAAKSELGVTSNNELSNAYSVRGGSYNENQFFIDGFEIYRPLRTKQGEQEGLGLVNGDLTSRMTLFAGGFPVRYGGKLASVLDATYARPQGAWGGTTYGSTLDGGGMVQGAITDDVGLAVAARSARPQRFFAGQELEGGYDPDFRDVQGVADVRLGAGHSVRAIGLYARHRFRLAPSQRETTFGIFPNLVRTVAIDFEGVEEDGYDVAFGGLLFANALSDRVRAEHRVSLFQTDEFEGYQVTSRTSLFRNVKRPDGKPSDFDRILEGTVLQRDTADNAIDQLTFTAQGRYLGQFGRHGAEVGWTARALSFDDRLYERTVFSGQDAETRAPTDVVAPDSLDDATTFRTWQASLWLEDAIDVLPDPGRLVLTPGVRADWFDYARELTLSPRLAAAYQAGENTTLLLGAGVYHQAPTYREFRGEPAPGQRLDSLLTGDIKSQRAIQLVGGVEQFFPGRRLRLRAEAYYKALSNLISYDVENVRVVYSGENDSRGYAAGFDLQLRGELVPGLESWINYGFLKTEERFDAPEIPDGATDDERQVILERFAARGGGASVRRPTDRRHNLSIFIQDYVPGDESWTLHIRALYGSSLPVTAPSLSETVQGTDLFKDGPRNRVELPSYFRFDLGATKAVNLGAGPLGRGLGLAATVEVLNVFDQANTIAYSWVRDGPSLFQAVPTRLTPRTLNVRLRMDF